MHAKSSIPTFTSHNYCDAGNENCHIPCIVLQSHRQQGWFLLAILSKWEWDSMIRPVYESAMKLIQFYLITEHVIWHSNLKHIKWCLNYLFCAWVWFTREWFLINVSIRWSEFLVHLIMKSCWRVSPLNRHGGPHPPSADIASHSVTALINQPSSPPWKRLYVIYYITEMPCQAHMPC